MRWTGMHWLAVAAILGVSGCAPSPASSPAPNAEDAAFPSSYDGSRAAFRNACRRVGAVCGQYKVRYADVADTDLTIDTAYATSGHDRLVIIQSGLHGVEGFAGAAVQQRVFDHHLPALLGHGFDVLMIHAVNPYGFRNLRRVDGNNVDLNRNFAPADQPGFYQQVNADYHALRDLAEPDEPVNGVDADSTWLSIRTVVAYVTHGFSYSCISNGTHAGQYESPHGFEFGGSEPAPQTGFLRQVVAPIMAAHHGSVIFLDLHTGLGAANTLTVISGLDWPADKVSHLRDFVTDLRDPGIRMEAPAQAAFQTRGDVIDFVPGLAGDPRRVTAVTLEWGTIGESTIDGLATNACMILENQAHFHGCRSPDICRQVRENFVALFNPPDAVFRRSVLAQADVFLNRLATLPADALEAAAAPRPAKPSAARACGGAASPQLVSAPS